MYLFFFKSSHVEECSRKRHKGVSVVANVSLTPINIVCLFFQNQTKMLCYVWIKCDENVV